MGVGEREKLILGRRGERERKETISQDTVLFALMMCIFKKK